MVEIDPPAQMTGTSSRRQQIVQPANYVWVDMARAAAAIVVVANHVRVFIFNDFAENLDVGWLVKAFYFFTGAGHQAVVVFFVLSGFLVGGHVYTAVMEQRWTWRDYLLKRLSRLWVVLLPALVLTMTCDQLGMAMTRSPVYAGKLSSLYHSTPVTDEHGNIYSLFTLLMNAVFLQTVYLPWLGKISTFGTNGPLWSLANEFWYYVIFPLLLIPLMAQGLSAVSRFIMFATGLFVCLALPTTMMLLGLVWLMGVAVFTVNRYVELSAAGYLAIGWISAPLLLLSLYIAYLHPGLPSDLLVGAIFSALLLSRIRITCTNGIVVWVARRMAQFSYTLYLTHFPLATLLACLFLKNRRYEPSALAFLSFFAMTIILLVNAYAISLLFENNTRNIQACLRRFLNRRTPGRSVALVSGSED